MEELASAFITGTCQFLPKSYDDNVANRRPMIQIIAFTEEPTQYAMFCGSGAEFYIRPVNSIIDDSDMLMWLASDMAFIEDLPVLPNDVSQLNHKITCYKMEPYRSHPSFVRLRELGEMNFDWTYKKFAFSHNPLPNKYIEYKFVDDDTSGRPTVKGPSIKRQASINDVEVDHVLGVWCPQWPREAQCWPKRYRDNGWPTIATISNVLQHGCHVVYAQHRACKDDKYQWRLSFSVAEVILLQSWTQVQQIVYHLLRFFAKRELILMDCPKEDEVLCTYHLKTLVLWTCEEMPLKWWNSSSVIAICCKLLHKLSEWLKRKYYPNYFIPEANLFNEPSRSAVLDEIERRLNKFRNCDTLCHWFIENYIQPITCRFEHTKTNLVDCMMTIIDFRKGKTGHSLNYLLRHEFQFYYTLFVHLHSLIPCLDFPRSLRNFYLLRFDALSIDMPMPEDVSCFRYLGKTLYSLLYANGIDCGKMSWNEELFFSFIKGICFKPKFVVCPYHNFPQPFTSAGSRLKFLLAQNIMEHLTGLNGHSECQLLSFVSREFLRIALECADSQSNGIVPPALVYLAALYFASSANQMVIDLCSEVLMDETIHEGSETLNAGCLFFIDDVVRIVGVYLICQKFSGNVHFSKGKMYVDLRLTPRLFAYYLTLKSAERMSRHLLMNHCLPSSALLIDQLLWTSTKRMHYECMTSTKSTIYLKTIRQCVRGRMDEIDALRMNHMRAEEVLIEHLTEYALENLEIFYRVIRKNLFSQFNAIDTVYCYRALYLYKNGEYDEVLRICKRILQRHDLVNDFKQLVFADVLVLPPFYSFFDGDVKSLFGFNNLFCYLGLSSLMGDLTFDRFTSNFFERFVFPVENNLSSSVYLYCPTKSHYSVGRHFVARYLKVRCCLDCNFPCEEAMADFASLEIIFPLEHIIRRYVLRKINITKDNY